MERDKIVFELIEKEHQRQLKGIELYARQYIIKDGSNGTGVGGETTPTNPDTPGTDTPTTPDTPSDPGTGSGGTPGSTIIDGADEG